MLPTEPRNPGGGQAPGLRLPSGRPSNSRIFPVISLRTSGLVAVAVVTATGIGLWQTGAWRSLVSHIPPLAQALGVETEPVGQPPVPEISEPEMPGMNVTLPPNIVTWRDSDGVVHFTTAADAPPTARQHTLGKTGTMADYEKALEQKEGITAEHLYRAQQARLNQEGKSATQPDGADAGKGDVPVDATVIASSQARDLLRQRDAQLEKIRVENAR